MKCINFDERFRRFAAQWMRKNAARYGHNADLMEAKMPALYLAWLNRPAPWLEGETPGAYFTRFSDAGMLAEWMLAYFGEGVPVPDVLLERLTALGAEAERALLAVLDRADVPEEALLTAVSLLSELGSAAPMERYIAWIAARKERDERAEMAAEALTAMGRAVTGPVLAAVRTATGPGLETFVDVLCNFPGEEAIFTLTLEQFQREKDKRALYASFLGKLGDSRALPALMKALENPGNYLEYLETRNAIEALGGDPPPPRDFYGDPYYESLRGME